MQQPQELRLTPRRLSIEETNVLARRLSDSKLMDHTIVLFEGKADLLCQICSLTEYRIANKYIEISYSHLCFGQTMVTIDLNDVFQIELYQTKFLRRSRLVVHSARSFRGGGAANFSEFTKDKLTIVSGEEIFNRLCSAISVMKFPNTSQQVVLYDGPASGCCKPIWYRVTTQYISERRGYIWHTMDFIMLFNVVKVEMINRLCSCAAELRITLELPGHKKRKYKMYLDPTIAKALHRKINEVIASHAQRLGIPNNNNNNNNNTVTK